MASKKKWFKSKGLWLGVLTFLISAIEIIRSLVESGDYSYLAMVTAATGILKIVERITSTGATLET